MSSKTKVRQITTEIEDLNDCSWSDIKTIQKAVRKKIKEKARD